MTVGATVGSRVSVPVGGGVVVLVGASVGVFVGMLAGATTSGVGGVHPARDITTPMDEMIKNDNLFMTSLLFTRPDFLYCFSKASNGFQTIDICQCSSERVQLSFYCRLVVRSSHVLPVISIEETRRKYNYRLRSVIFIHFQVISCRRQSYPVEDSHILSNPVTSCRRYV